MSVREEQFPGAHKVGAERALQRNAEQAYSFQLASTRERSDVNRAQPTRFNQWEIVAFAAASSQAMKTSSGSRPQ